MNIFFIDSHPDQAAIYMMDKHIVKMPLESAQMLSTAHRLLDGKLTQSDSKQVYLLEGESLLNSEIQNQKCYKVAHKAHPCTIWTIKTAGNYLYHLNFLVAMLKEYKRRYGRTHSVEKLLPFLKNIPKNISEPSVLHKITPPPQCMPDKYKHEDLATAYRNFYAGEKFHFAKWKENDMPDWFLSHMAKVWDKDEEKLLKLNKCLSKKTLPADSRVILMAQELTYETFKDAF